MEFVNVEPCGYAAFSVFDDPVLDALHHDQHGDRGQLGSQIADAVDCKTVVHIHVCLVIKDV